MNVNGYVFNMYIENSNQSDYVTTQDCLDLPHHTETLCTRLLCLVYILIQTFEEL